MKKIGIMGGTFNPIHSAHLAIAEQAMDEFGLEKIMFLPNNIPPHKECDNSVSSTFRIEMVKAAIEDNDRFFLSLYEIEKGGFSYTVDTLRHFSNEYDDIYFIIGGDSVRDFPKWYKPDEISKLCTFIAYPRENLDFKAHAQQIRDLYGAKVLELDAPRLDISSSDIRLRLKQNKTVRYLVPEKVFKIIEENKLYE